VARYGETQADRCRAALKAAGYTARQVTVRATGHRDAIVTIRDASVSRARVEAVIGPACPPREFYGDGQPFTAKSYAVEYLDAILDPIADEIERRLLAAGASTIKIGLHRVHMSHDRYSGTDPRDADSWVDGRNYCIGVRGTAERLAAELLSDGASLDAPPPVVAVPTLRIVRDAPDPNAWVDRLDL